MVALVGVVGLVAGPTPIVSAEANRAATSIRPAALAPALPHDATRLGAVDPAQAVALEVVLAPSHPQELASLLHALSNPSSPDYQHWLAPGEFARRFGPSRAHVAAVVDWLHRVGLSDTTVSDGRVKVHATSRSASAALRVSMSRYRLANGEEGFSTRDAPLVPRAVASHITAIVGLTEMGKLQPHHQVGRRLGASSTTSAQPRAISCATSIQQQANKLEGWTTRQIAAKYQVPALWNAGLTGAGQTIALYELEPHAADDTAEYLTCFGLHNTITTRTVDGGAPGDTSASTEANLDIEAAAATAPGAQIVSYEGPNTEAGSVDVWAAIVNDDEAQTISTSWGRCEAREGSAERQALHALFTQAATQGQSVFSASGDAGSEGCVHEGGGAVLSVDSPSDDPLVTAVGGTSLLSKLALTDPKHEPVWNDCLTATGSQCANTGGAGGGGLSHSFAKPIWQPVAAASTCAKACRQVPDIALNAGSGEAIATDGVWTLVGGTSVAAPKLAAIAADIATGCVDRIGEYNPKLYALAKTGVYGIALRDVPAGEGNTDLTRNHANRYPAAKGFDLATGLGTPIATGLACPAVNRVTPAGAAAGAHVTVTGLALARATIAFGGKTAKVLSHTTTSVVVIVPSGTGAVDVSASDAMGQGTRHASFAYPAPPS